MKYDPLSTIENRANAKRVLAKTQGSLPRIRAALRLIVRRKASHQRVRELWFLGCIR